MGIAALPGEGAPLIWRTTSECQIRTTEGRWKLHPNAPRLFHSLPIVGKFLDACDVLFCNFWENERTPCELQRRFRRSFFFISYLENGSSEMILTRDRNRDPWSRVKILLEMMFSHQEYCYINYIVKFNYLVKKKGKNFKTMTFEDIKKHVNYKRFPVISIEILSYIKFIWRIAYRSQ